MGQQLRRNIEHLNSLFKSYFKPMLLLYLNRCDIYGLSLFARVFLSRKISKSCGHIFGLLWDISLAQMVSEKLLVLNRTGVLKNRVASQVFMKLMYSF
jgi:hypothetical protein